MPLPSPALPLSQEVPGGALASSPNPLPTRSPVATRAQEERQRAVAALERARFAASERDEERVVSKLLSEELRVAEGAEVRT